MLSPNIYAPNEVKYETTKTPKLASILRESRRHAKKFLHNTLRAIMHMINTNKLAEETWSSPKGKFVGAGKEISEALGRKPQSTDLNERHPFDVSNRGQYGGL